MGLIGEILGEIWNNFNSAEGKIIVGGLINLILLGGILIHLLGGDRKGALKRAAIMLASSALFSFLATLHPGAPSFFTAFKVLGISSGIVFLGVLAFGAFAYLTDGSSGSTQTSTSSRRDDTVYDQYGMPINLKRVGGHYEDERYGDPYEVHGNHAVAQSVWMETEDGDSIQVTPEGGGYYMSYGHQYRVNSRGKLEEI